jgi:hypothetical protein
MDFSELQREVKSVVGDQSPTILLTIPDCINEAIAQIAEEVHFPELRQISSVAVSTTTYFANMPTTFSSRLKYAGNSDGQFKILDSLEELLELYPALDSTGDIEYVHCSGNILYYQPIPTVATNVTCVGYHSPALLVNDTDTPSFIPSYIHRDAIVNRAAAVCYNIIEDGVEGEKINTRVFTGLAEMGLNKIREYISRRRPVVGRSVWSY